MFRLSARRLLMFGLLLLGTVSVMRVILPWLMDETVVNPVSVGDIVSIQCTFDRPGYPAAWWLKRIDQRWQLEKPWSIGVEAAQVRVLLMLYQQLHQLNTGDGPFVKVSDLNNRRHYARCRYNNQLVTIYENDHSGLFSSVDGQRFLPLDRQQSRLLHQPAQLVSLSPLKNWQSIEELIVIDQHFQRNGQDWYRYDIMQQDFSQVDAALMHRLDNLCSQWLSLKSLTVLYLPDQPQQTGSPYTDALLDIEWYRLPSIHLINAQGMPIKFNYRETDDAQYYQVFRDDYRLLYTLHKETFLPIAEWQQQPLPDMIKQYKPFTVSR